MPETLHVTSSKDRLIIHVTLWENFFEKVLTQCKTRWEITIFATNSSYNYRAKIRYASKSFRFSEYHSLICSVSGNQCFSPIASLNPLKTPDQNVTDELFLLKDQIKENVITFFPIKLDAWNFALINEIFDESSSHNLNVAIVHCLTNRSVN